MSEYAWLANLKAGDQVVRSYGYGVRTLSLATVERVTPTQIVLPHGERYRREDGGMIGRGRSMASVEPTPERLAAIRKEHVAGVLARDVVWSSLSLETLEAVLKLVKP